MATHHMSLEPLTMRRKYFQPQPRAIAIRNVIGRIMAFQDVHMPIPRIFVCVWLCYMAMGNDGILTIRLSRQAQIRNVLRNGTVEKNHHIVWPWKKGIQRCNSATVKVEAVSRVRILPSSKEYSLTDALRSAQSDICHTLSLKNCMIIQQNVFRHYLGK